MIMLIWKSILIYFSPTPKPYIDVDKGIIKGYAVRIRVFLTQVFVDLTWPDVLDFDIVRLCFFVV